jgi:hypothetical protein
MSAAKHLDPDAEPHTAYVLQLLRACKWCLRMALCRCFDVTSVNDCLHDELLAPPVALCQLKQQPATNSVSHTAVHSHAYTSYVLSGWILRMCTKGGCQLGERSQSGSVVSSSSMISALLHRKRRPSSCATMNIVVNNNAASSVGCCLCGCLHLWFMCCRALLQRQLNAACGATPVLPLGCVKAVDSLA